jgi:hypothetical protein
MVSYLPKKQLTCADHGVLEIGTGVSMESNVILSADVSDTDFLYKVNYFTFSGTQADLEISSLTYGDFSCD